MSFNKILYVGCGTHLEVLLHFQDTKEFVFIDTQPLSEYDATIYYKPFYRPNFINIVLSKLRKLNFMIQSVTNLDKKYYKKIFTLKQKLYYLFYRKPEYINPSLLTFYNIHTKQTIKYYVSTDIDNTNISELHNDIKSCDTLLVSGYFPSINYLKYFTTPIKFIGYSNTCYNIDKDNSENNIIQYFYRNKDLIQQYILDFYAIDNSMDKYIENVIIQLCSDFDDFIEIVNKMFYSFTLDYKNYSTIICNEDDVKNI
jgi:hypothetical protein